MGYIDQQEVYRTTESGKQIFQHYFPGYPFGSKKTHVSIRADDKTPSALISLYNGLWRITDFGNQQEVNSMPAVQFVMWREGLEFVDALRFIQEVILGRKINGTPFKKPRYQAEYDWREMTPNDQKGKYNFKYKESPTEKDLKSVGRYVTAPLLKRFNCRAVTQYELCSFSKKHKRDVVHIFKSTDDFPIFVFDYGDFKKLYKPFELDKKYRFSYIGTKPKDFIYGHEQLKAVTNEFVNAETGDHSPPKNKPDARVKELYRCSGESDALNLASLGFHVYWLNSETATMNHAQWKKLDALCLNHYQIMDMDETGQQSALSFALKHIKLHTIALPQWLNQKKDWRGNPCKDLKDFVNISGSEKEQTLKNFQVLKRKSMPIKFWSTTTAKNGNVSYHLNLEYYYHFLKAHGFYVMDSIYHKKAGYCYARVKGKVIDLVHPDDIKRLAKRFTKEWIRSKNLKDEIQVLNKINSSNQIGEANLQELVKVEPVFTHSTKTEEFIHFNNGSLRITKESIEKIAHSELKANILGQLIINNRNITHVQDRNISLIKTPMFEVKTSEGYQELLDRLNKVKTTEEREKINVELATFAELDRYSLKINDEDFIFIQFLKDLSRIHWRQELENSQELTEEEKKEQELVMINLLFVLGLNLAEYKDPNRPWLTFLQDMKISQVGKSSGRSGKSVLSSAIGFVRPTFYVAGRHKDITNKTDFIYDGFTKLHNNIEIDDLYEYADFNFFYTQITGKREINSKHISKQILDYPDSGKMLISSNFELQNTDSSTLARILNAGVSDYYHEKTKYNDYKETRSLASKFGKNIYDDFTEEEWNKFYNLAANCIQLSQRFNKIQPPMANLEKRQLRREMTRGVGKEEEFYIWANTYFVPAPENNQEEISPEHETFGYFNRFIVKEKAFEHFKETLPKSTAGKYKATQFKKSLKAFCEYYAYELNPIEKCGSNQANIDSRRIVKTIDGRTSEVFYISTGKEMDTPNFQEASKTENELPF